MLKIFAAFAAFAGLALFLIFKAGDKVDLQGENHQIQVEATSANSAAPEKK